MRLVKPFVQIDLLAECPACGAVVEVAAELLNRTEIVTCGVKNCKTEFMVDDEIELKDETPLDSLIAIGNMAKRQRRETLSEQCAEPH